MQHPSTGPNRQKGAQIIEYALIIALISVVLAAALGGAISDVPDNICSLGDRVSQLMGGQGVDCG